MKLTLIFTIFIYINIFHGINVVYVYRECLIQTVQHSTEAEVKCPFRDENYSCESALQEREIKAVRVYFDYIQDVVINKNKLSRY